MSKAFTNLWYNTKLEKSEPEEYKKTTIPGMTPERRYIYEVLVILRTHISDRTRTSFPITYVTNVKD